MRPKFMTWIVLPASILGVIGRDLGVVRSVPASWIGHGAFYFVNLFHRLWLMFCPRRGGLYLPRQTDPGILGSRSLWYACGSSRR